MVKQKRAKDYEIHELTCPKCGKIIVSLSEAQADYNMKAHAITCKGVKK
jgi:hypothetical protein